MGAEMPSGEFGEGQFRRDRDFDPHLERFLGEVVRYYGVPIDTVSANLNGRGYVSDKFSDPSYQQEPPDPFENRINRSDKPEA